MRSENSVNFPNLKTTGVLNRSRKIFGNDTFAEASGYFVSEKTGF